MPENIRKTESPNTTQSHVVILYQVKSKTYSFPNRQTCRKHGWSGKQKQNKTKK